MSSSVDFYTTGDYLKTAVVLPNPTSEYTVDPINVSDLNLNTYCVTHEWSGNTIAIDTCPQDEDAYDAGRGEPSGSFDAYSLWIVNYDTEFDNGTDDRIFVLHSLRLSPGSAEWSHLLTNSNFNHSTGNPLYFKDLDHPAEKRYLKIFVQNPLNDIKISWVGFHKKHTIQTRPEYPLKPSKIFFNDTTDLGGGKEYVTAEANNYVTQHDFKFTFLSTANKDAFENVHTESCGVRYPLIYQPGTSMSDAILCRLGKDKSDIDEVYNGFYKATLKDVTTLPYIKDGDTM